MKRCISLFTCLIFIFSLLTIPCAAEEKEISVLMNETKMEFDVPPMLVNGRTMVPLRSIFEALGAKVYWSGSNETVSGISSDGDRVVISIGSNVATVNDVATDIDAPPIIVNGRTLVPLRFISETFGCEVGWDGATKTVSIKSENEEKNIVDGIWFYTVANFSVSGGWGLEDDDILRGKITQESVEVTNDDAILNLNIEKDGRYKIWCYSKDYATNQPGSRYFNVAVDGVRSPTKFGAHGKEGFNWDEVGTYSLSAGIHTVALQDTSAFYARCRGILVTTDMNFVPSNNFDECLQYKVNDANFDTLASANFPGWAKRTMTDSSSETIENEKIKMVFYEGVGEKGSLVQNEIFLKKDGEWIPVKTRSEDLGVLVMRAESAEIGGYHSRKGGLTGTPWHLSSQTFAGLEEGKITTILEDNYYRTGKAEWLVPQDIQKIDDKTVVLNMTSENVDATLTFTLDDVSYEPKATFNAAAKKSGAYSFSYFTGDEFKDGSFSRVTAPFLYLNKDVPDTALVLAEYTMFTPMISFTFGVGNDAVTKGVAVDPSFVKQRVSYPGESDFGITFRSPTGNVRGQLIAPLFGDEDALLDAGESYTFAYRLLYNDSDWFDNFKHVAQDIYNSKDLRTNYYASLNDAIYNATDLMMDDMYGGWDEKDMAFYNMEAKMVTTQSNPVEMMQKYMLTDNQEILERRAIPSLAYILSRGGMHMKRVEGENSYTSMAPVPLSGTTGFAPSSYVALYQMSQGRTPFLFNHALRMMSTVTDMEGVAAAKVSNEMAPDERYIETIKNDADSYMEDLYSDDFVPNGGFVYSVTIPMVNAFTLAYEATGEQKYLDAAKTAAAYLTTTLWTTGYQNGYADTDYTVDPIETAERSVANDTVDWYYHKDGVKWRIGNPYGVMSGASEAQNKLKEETAPGWIPARVGLGTEHTITPANANAIIMNMWAGTLVRLAKYTGEDYFLSTARNAMIGRFANYAGYYNDRLLLHDKQAEYPYEGPDYNLIYWHHIPVFLGLLEDFLINNIWYRSEGNIEFPSAINSGYAYFVSNQYGFAPGKFYDEEDMWLWLDRGIIQPDSVNVDYITAKKDGVLGLALVNEDDESLTTTITLGDKIPNSETFTETAILYDKDGNKSNVEIVNGKFTVTIPARGIQSVVLHPEVAKPSFAKEYTVSDDFDGTVVQLAYGKAYLLQFNDYNYYAYIYTTKMPTDTKAVEFKYSVNGKNYTKTVDEYPFEMLVKVDSPTSDFKFTVTTIGLNNEKTDLGGGTLTPVRDTELEPYTYGNIKQQEIVSALPEFSAFDMTPKAIGCANSLLRIVVPGAEAPFKNITLNYMAGAKIKTILTLKETNEDLLLESIIVGNEVRSNGDLVLLVEGTKNVPVVDYAKTAILNPVKILPPDASFEDYAVEKTGEITVNPALKDFQPFTVKDERSGETDKFRIIVPVSQFPFEISENLLRGLAVIVKAIPISGGETIEEETVVLGNEMRGGTTILVFDPVGNLKIGKKIYENYKFEITFKGK